MASKSRVGRSLEVRYLGLLTKLGGTDLRAEGLRVLTVARRFSRRRLPGPMPDVLNCARCVQKCAGAEPRTRAWCVARCLGLPLPERNPN